MIAFVLSSPLEMNDVLANVLLGITVAAPLGPATVAIIKNGLKHGFWGAFLTALGVVTGDTTYLLLVSFGLSQFITIPAVRIAIWACGTLVLAYLGYQSIKEFSRRADLGRYRQQREGNLYVAGLSINLTNPMAIVWWAGVFGSLLASSAYASTEVGAVLLSLTVVAGILLWHTFLSILTHWGNRFLNENTFRYISAASGLILIAYGVNFGSKAVAAFLHLGGS